MIAQSVLQQYLKELEFLHWQNASCEVILVSPQKIRALNNKWRGVDNPTDILSFPLFSHSEIQKLDGGQPVMLGSLVLCKEWIKKFAVETNDNFGSRLELTLKHGLKHLLGYAHDESGEKWTPLV